MNYRILFLQVFAMVRLYFKECFESLIDSRFNKAFGPWGSDPRQSLSWFSFPIRRGGEGLQPDWLLTSGGWSLRPGRFSAS